MSYQMVSCDDHMDLNCLPPKLWEERLPAAFKDRAPKVVEMPQGPSWVREGERWGYHGSREAAGMVSKFTNFGIPERGGARRISPLGRRDTGWRTWTGTASTPR